MTARTRPRRRAPQPSVEDLVRLGLAVATLNEAVRLLCDPEAPNATEALNRAMARASHTTRGHG